MVPAPSRPSAASSRPRASRSVALVPGFALAAVGLSSCYWEPPTYKPPDAAFELSCPPRCGAEFAGPALVVGVDFAKVRREFEVCCPRVPSFVARLKELRDGYCRTGKEALGTRIADLTIEPFESPLDGARGVKLDQGNGYVVFRCDGWLGDLIAKSEASCCAAP
ncbi:MAG: hypothetical protein IT373_31220 [Polyangiaceae bacterium]|nr:hypothetical protein [Polyangiaceae bacterium]